MQHQIVYTGAAVNAARRFDITDARARLEQAGQQHMLHLQAAIAVGTPTNELRHHVDEFASAARRLLVQCTSPTSAASMLVAMATPGIAPPPTVPGDAACQSA